MSFTVEPQHAKERGAYYTPPQVADFLASWAIDSPSARVLEPACGEGVFLSAAERLVPRGHIVGVELHGAENPPPVSLDAPYTVVLHQDFFVTEPDQLGLFDAVIGNPPFIRYQRLAGERRHRALEQARRAGVVLTDLSSSWAPFVVHATRFLKPQGRLAMVCPAELTHASYARSVLAHLVRWFDDVWIVRFHQSLFPGLNEETLLLLAGPKRSLPQSVGRLTTVVLDSVADLRSGQALTGRVLPVVDSDVERGHIRSSLQLISPTAADLYTSLAGRQETRRLGEIASVGIGYVTGANDFFHLTDESVRYWGFRPEDVRPALVRGRSLSRLGLAFRHTDWEDNRRTGSRCYLFDPALPLSPWSRSYVQEGEAREVHRSYKCRCRKTWYKIPGLRVPQAILTVMAHAFPVLMANEAGVLVSNSLHEVFLRDDRMRPRQLTGATWNSLTLLSSEVEGHSLGGGMLKLEPTEAERLLIPPVDAASDAELDQMDSLLADGNVQEAIDFGNTIYLRRGMQMSEEEVSTLELARRELNAFRCKRPAGKRRHRS